MFQFLRKSDGGRLPRPFWVLWVGTLINRLGQFVVPFFALYLTSVRGLSVSQAALVVSLYGLGAFASSLSGGLLADSIGRRATMILSMTLAAVMTFIFSWLTSLWLIALLAVPLGYCIELYRPASSAAIADLVPVEGRVRAFGLIYWAINVGASVAPILAGLVLNISFQILFLADALTSLVFAGLIAWGVPETRVSSQGQHELVGSVQEKAGLWSALRDIRLLAYTVLACLFACVYFQYSITLPLDMRLHGLGSEQYGLVIALNGIIIVLISVPVSHIVTRFPRALVLTCSSLLMGIGFGLVAFWHVFPWYAFTVIIWTFGELLGSPVTSALVADLAPQRLRGTYQGVYGMAWGLASFVAPVLGGAVFEHLGTRALWGGCFVIGVLIACGYLLLARVSATSKQVRIHQPMEVNVPEQAPF